MLCSETERAKTCMRKKTNLVILDAFEITTVFEKRAKLNKIIPESF